MLLEAPVQLRDCLVRVLREALLLELPVVSLPHDDVDVAEGRLDHLERVVRVSRQQQIRALLLRVGPVARERENAALATKNPADRAPSTICRGSPEKLYGPISTYIPRESFQMKITWRRS